jgi:hypothetical protein
MSSGVLCVHPNFGGLTDTSGGMNFMYQGHSDANKHANIFYHALEHAINNVEKEDMQNYLKLVKMYADSRFAWSKIVGQWGDLLTGLKQQYPTIESRKPKSEMFVYNV